MKKSIVAIALIFAISGCGQNPQTLESSAPAEDSARQSVLGTASLPEESEDVQEPAPENEMFKTALASYDEDSIAVYYYTGRGPKNIHLLERWIENYKSGQPDEVAVMLDDEMYPAAIFIFRCDGTAEYSITEYPEFSDEGEEFYYTSSLIVDRALDYVFGSDFKTDERIPIIVHKELLAPEAMELGDPAFEGAVSYDEAAEIAERMDERFLKYRSVLGGYWLGGTYLSDNILAVAPPIPAAETSYNVAGAVMLGGYPCYRIQETAQGGNISAVSADGSLFFYMSMNSRTWSLINDSNEKIITHA